ncbi:hypothetical protein MANES_09G001301v8 [Manihot esculenta]|uniref:Uncharacterized protein n=1 Tax=Manihot esculenta TaxID=3983 RepID=A0ACB7H1G4_MANES|nr:hypothetical protein MANES_09G001301v8 [Manihot esculenta]
MAEVKTTVTDVIPVMTKITEHKLNGSNFLDWSKTIRIYLRSIEMDDHLTKDPLTDETRRDWMIHDACLFLQIRNSIHSEVISLINHCEFALYRAQKNDRTLISYFMDFKRVYEELNVLMPFNTDVKTQQTQREQMAVMSFLAGLPPKVLHTESPIPSHPTSALVSRNDSGRQNNRGGQRGGFNAGKRSQHSGETGPTSDSGGIICYYCREPEYTKKTCQKLQNKNQRTQMAHMAVDAPSDQGILISEDEYAQFTQYQASLKSSNSSSITAIAESGSFDEADYW